MNMIKIEVLDLNLECIDFYVLIAITVVSCVALFLAIRQAMRDYKIYKHEWLLKLLMFKELVS